MMKIGFLGKENAIVLEILRRLQREHPDDEFSAWQPGAKAPSTELEVIFAFGDVDSEEIEAQTRLGLIQMAPWLGGVWTSARQQRPVSG